mgnify:CR=1 FL=1
MKRLYRLMVLWLAGRMIDHLVVELDNTMGPSVSSPLDDRINRLVFDLAAVRRAVAERSIP